MTAIALQKRLLKQIAEINDVTVLKKIDQIVKTSPKVYQLSEEQIEQVRVSQKQYENGEYITSEEMSSLVKVWAKKQ